MQNRFVKSLGVLVLGFSALFLLSSCVDQGNDRGFIKSEESALKDMIHKQLDPENEHIRSIQIDYNSIKGEFDNGGDVSGDYDVTLTAIINNKSHLMINMDLNFPEATVGPFTFHYPDPYKTGMIEDLSDAYLSISGSDSSQKNMMKSWWKWNNNIWLEELLNSESNTMNQKILEIFVKHKTGILSASGTIGLKNIVNGKASDGNYYSYFYTTVNGGIIYGEAQDTLYLVLFLREPNGDNNDDAYLYLTKENFFNTDSPITIEVNDEKKIISSDDNPDWKADLKSVKADLDKQTQTEISLEEKERKNENDKKDEKIFNGFCLRIIGIYFCVSAERQAA